MTPARTPEELDHIPRSASVYDTAPPAIAVLSKALACDQVQALEVLRAIIEAGYFIAPRIPSDQMLAAYFTAFGQQAWNPRTIVQNIGKARLRWQAMGQAGTAYALSRKHINEPQAAATITDLRARIAELEADKAQWVEIERMQLGITAHTPQSAPAHSQADLDSRGQRG